MHLYLYCTCSTGSLDREDEEEEFDEDNPYPLTVTNKIEKSEESDEEVGPGSTAFKFEKVDSAVETQDMSKNVNVNVTGQDVNKIKNIKNEGSGSLVKEMKGEETEEAQIEFDAPVERTSLSLNLSLSLSDEVGVTGLSGLVESR